MIAVIFITLGFSCIMPVLNIIATCSFLLMFLCDKVLIFKVFRKPPNYDHKMQKKLIRLLYLALMIHLIGTAFLISEPNLVVEGSTISLATVLDSSVNRINILFQTTYILPYIILFILMALFVVLKGTILRLFFWCGEKCTDSGKTKVLKYKLEQNFYEALDSFQINQLITAGENMRNQFASNRMRTQFAVNT